MGENTMKKMLAIVAILMLVPFTASAMEMMPDTALEDVTAQAGVTISIDNIQMDFRMDYLSWGDGDGIGGSAAGYVNITGIEMTNIVFDKLAVGASGIAPIAGTHIVAGASAAMDFDLTDGTSDLRNMTIDVGDLTTVDAGGNIYTDTAVAIGIPTISIYVGAIAPFDIALDSAAGATGTAIGSIALGGMQMDTKGGRIFILAH
jgi:hypothetical protein